jgi:DNA-damage-inducible protein J
MPAAAHDVWFKAKVMEALKGLRPAVPHDQAEAHFAERRIAAMRMVAGKNE